jgi:hypothetical protein
MSLENILKSSESCQENMLESETDVVIFAELEELQECIELMLSLELVEKREIKGKQEYCSKI